MLRHILKQTRVVTQKLDALLAKNENSVKDGEITSMLPCYGCHLTKEVIKDIIHYGFPFESHEKNKQYGWIYPQPLAKPLTEKELAKIFLSASLPALKQKLEENIPHS